MQFSTKVPIPKSHNPINYTSEIVAMGSCFAENMGAKFEYFKFRNAVNPFGIIFNPVSIEKLVSRIVNREEFTENDIFFHNERWHCYDVHSDLSHSDKKEFLKTLNQIIGQSNHRIIESTHVIITYGTSWIYKLKSSNEVVANCHKVPQKEFKKEILCVSAIEEAITTTIAAIQKVNPHCNIILTVSPVRHIKDGFVENQRSKAHLLAAIHNVLSNVKADYFPSYEIMMDELRDYRFYAQDMLHPNQIAVDYIWERFFETFTSGDSHPTMETVCSIQKGLMHRPFHPDSESHQKFVADIRKKIDAVQQQFPHIRFE